MNMRSLISGDIPFGPLMIKTRRLFPSLFMRVDNSIDVIISPSSLSNMAVSLSFMDNLISLPSFEMFESRISVIVSPGIRFRYKLIPSWIHLLRTFPMAIILQLDGFINVINL